jgi:hypothetical protein
MSDIVSAPRMVVSQFIRHHLPVNGVQLPADQLDSLVVQVGRGARAGAQGGGEPGAGAGRASDSPCARAGGAAAPQQQDD